MDHSDCHDTAKHLVLALGVLCISCGSDSPSQSATSSESMVAPFYDCGVSEGEPDFSSLVGKAIAVDTPSGLRVIEPTSGAESLLPGYSFHSWSPDGRLLAAVRGGETSIFDRELGAARITVPTEAATWSPVGRRLGYFEHPYFVVVDIDSGESTRADVCPPDPDVPEGLERSCTSAGWSQSFDRILVSRSFTWFSVSEIRRPDGSDAQRLPIARRSFPAGSSRR